MGDVTDALTRDEVGAICAALNWSLTHPDKTAVPFVSDGVLYEIAPSAEDIRNSLRLFSAAYRQMCEEVADQRRGDLLTDHDGLGFWIELFQERSDTDGTEI